MKITIHICTPAYHLAQWMALRASIVKEQNRVNVLSQQGTHDPDKLERAIIGLNRQLQLCNEMIYGNSHLMN